MHFLASCPTSSLASVLNWDRQACAPRCSGWGVCIVGALSGLAVAITILVMGHTYSSMLAAVSVLPFLATSIMVFKDLSNPFVNDITTDLDNPLAFVAARCARANADRDITYPEHFKHQDRKGYPRVQPIILDEPADQAFERVCHLAKSRPGWQVTPNKTVEAEAMTSLLHIVDDVIVWVSNHEGKSRVNMRSKSREGHVDAGKNAKRTEMFREQVQQSKGADRARSLDPSDTCFAST